MAQLYTDKLTGATTDKPTTQDKRTGTIIYNTPQTIGHQASATGTPADYYSALRGGSPQQMREAQYRVGEMTGRSIGGNNQPSAPPGASVEFGAIGPVPEGRQNPTPGVTYSGTPSQRMAAAEQNIRAENLVRQMNVDPDSLRAEAIREAYKRPGYTPGVENLDPLQLEKYRQDAEAAGDTRREGQYGNQIQQWAQNKVELGSSYHYLGKRSGVAVPANPYEYTADLSVEFLKGKPQKSGDMFSPVSGEESRYLPGGYYGLQSLYWDKALNRDNPGSYAAPVMGLDYTPAIQHIQSSIGRYGPYGGLFGGDRYTGSPSSDGLRKQPDFVFTPEARANVDAAIRVSEIERGYSPGLRSSGTYTPLVLQGGPIEYGDIQAYPEAAGLGRLVGSKTVAGTPVIVAEGAHATELNSFRKTCDKVNQSFQQQTGTPAGVLPAPFRSTTTPGVKAVEQSPSWFDMTGKAIAGMPILGDIYRAGASVKKNTPERANALQGFFTTAPVLSNVALGGATFAAKKDYDLAIETFSPVYEKQATGYKTNLSVYSENVDAFNLAVSQYDLNRTDAGYSNLKATEGSLESQKTALDVEYGELSKTGSRMDFAGEKYKNLAAQLVGPETNEQTKTYSIASPFLGAGKAYREGIVNPAERLVGKGIVQSAALGFLGVPGAIPETIGMAIIGGERTAKNIYNFPALAAAGGAMTAESAIEDPVRFGAGLLGTYGLFRAGGIITQKGIGLARSAGKEYVPIENIGYDTNVGYPIKPVSGTSRQLIESFYENKLIPEPTQMSAGKTPTTPGITPPYLHGKGGVPAAKLPTTQPGDPLLWTAHESNALAKGVKVGEAYKMTGTGTSELDSISAAPVAEGYFAKTGGMIPENIGFSSPFKSPTIYATVVQGLETIPGKVKAALPRNAQGKITDYSVVNQYMQKRLTAAPGGQAFVPMLKGEFEANIATNSIFEVTGRKYYTKLGGIGKSHFGGTRVPIVEQDLIGFSPAETPLPQIKSTRPGSSYRSGAEIGGYSAIGASAVSMVYGGYSKKPLSPTSSRSPTALDSGASSRRTPVSSTPFSGSSAGSKPSSSIGGSKGSYSRGSSPVESYIPSQYKSVVSPSKTTSTTSPRSNLYTPPKTSPITSKTTPPYTPPYTPPRTPPATPPGSPWTPIISPFDGGGSGSSFFKPRKAAFMETFNMGLDIGGAGGKRIMSPAKSFSPTRRAPPRRKAPVVRKLKTKRK